MSTGDFLMAVGFAGMIVIWLVQMWFIYDLLKTLRLRFPQQWEKLGKPTLILNNSLANNWAVWRFLRQRDYIALEDKAFTKRCTAMRTFMMVALFVAFLWVAVGLGYILATQKVH